MNALEKKKALLQEFVDSKENLKSCKANYIMMKKK